MRIGSKLVVALSCRCRLLAWLRLAIARMCWVELLRRTCLCRASASFTPRPMLRNSDAGSPFAPLLLVALASDMSVCVSWGERMGE